MILGKFALCVMLFYACDGTPSDGVTPPEIRRRGKHMYTDVEENFIIQQVIDHLERYGKPVWDLIAAFHERKRRSGVYGFNNKRSPLGLSKHFVDKMLRGEGLVEVPPILIQKFRGRRYNPEETALINEELLAWRGSTIYSDLLWKSIAKKHASKKAAGDPGFYKVRSSTSLFTHFREFMIVKNMVPDTLRQKYPRDFETMLGQSAAGPSQPNVQASNESEELHESVIEFYDFFQKELENALREQDESEDENIDDGNDDDDNELTRLRL